MLGPRIAALRRASGWSQAELAQRLRISPSTVGMYEQGRREPSVDALVAMSALFGVSTDFLLTGTVHTPDEQAISSKMLGNALRDAQYVLERRQHKPFSMDELAAVLSAMLSQS